MVKLWRIIAVNQKQQLNSAKKPIEEWQPIALFDEEAKCDAYLAAVDLPAGVKSYNKMFLNVASLETMRSELKALPFNPTANGTATED